MAGMTMAAAATDEEARVRQVVEQIALPKGVRLKSVQLGADWEGDPAWRIVFALSRNAPATPAFSRGLNVLIDEIVDRVTGLATNKFPYVSFEGSGSR